MTHKPDITQTAYPRLRRPRLLVLATVLTLATTSGLLQGQDFAPFVIPDDIDPRQPIWMQTPDPIKVDSARLVAKGEAFSREGMPVRIWGVNLSFAANFPVHEDAVRIAIRLAAAGVNSVRCHHMDTAQWPRGIWNTTDGRTFEPEALDRLDYFINELAKRGIYTNINLHVGREHSRYLGLPQTNRNYDKISGLFTPALIEAQKKCARDLLGHVNPYRKARYADDPAVAFVEITNEDSFFMWSSDQTLRTLPEYYNKILEGQFNQWLARRYQSDPKALLAAWSKDTEPLGENLLRNADFGQWDARTNFPPNWNLEQHAGCQASVSKASDARKNAVEIRIAKADETAWHLQLTQGRLRIEPGHYYTVSFEARSDRDRELGCSIGQAHDPWHNLGFSRTARLSDRWQRFSFGFLTNDGDDNARISFILGGNDASVHLANVEVRPGGQVALAEGESLTKANIKLFQHNESQARIIDRMMFLAETEKAYFDDMRAFIKSDLKCDALVTGTIVFGPLGLYAQSDMDFIDAHAYWQHPRFPGRPWDQGNWVVEQKPMTDFIEEATLFRLAAERLAGKPFTVSEYNHPAPLDSQAECVPMLASFAAAQGWNGLWFYTYSHDGDNWDRKHLNSFFDIDTNPAKWGFMRAGAALFRDAWVQPLERETRTVGSPRQLDRLAGYHLQNDTNMFDLFKRLHDVTPQSMLKLAIVPRYGDVPASSESHLDTRDIKWASDRFGHGLYQIAEPQAQVYIGHARQFLYGTNGAADISSPKFLALTVTPLDEGTSSGQSDAPAQKLLVTACGRCENTEMQFSQDRRTVGRNWGHGPVRIETVQGDLRLPEGKWSCHALAPDGSVKQKVAISHRDGQSFLQMSPEYETMWYLLERQEQ